MIDLLTLLDTLELQIVFGDLYDPETGIYPYDDDDIIEIWNLTSKKLGYDDLAMKKFTPYIALSEKANARIAELWQQANAMAKRDESDCFFIPDDAFKSYLIGLLIGEVGKRIDQ